MFSPTPNESIRAPCSSTERIKYSSNELEIEIFVSVNPTTSSIILAFLVRYAISPESIRIPANVLPIGCNTSSATLIAFGIPLFNVSYVSTNRIHESG